MVMLVTVAVLVAVVEMQLMVCEYTITGTLRVKVAIRNIKTKDSHKSVRIFVGRIEMKVRNSISNTYCTSGGEIEVVRLVT